MSRVEYPRMHKTVGMLEQQRIVCVEMPRARFLEIGIREIEKFRADWFDAETDYLRETLIPVMEGMERFPVGTWMHAQRGCGCVIGEYVVATSELDRAAVSRCITRLSISDMLKENPHSVILFAFGYAIDSAMITEIGGSSIEVQSVEIID